MEWLSQLSKNLSHMKQEPSTDPPSVLKRKRKDESAMIVPGPENASD